MLSHARLGLVAAVAFVVCSGAASRPAKASLLDIGGQIGFVERNLSDIHYPPGFMWQVHAELALIPPILMFGPYVGQATLTPDTSATGVRSVEFWSAGLRLKAKIPLGRVKPFILGGMGWVHGNFPDQTLTLCQTVNGYTGCVNETVPNATRDFVEFLLGGGAHVRIAGPLEGTFELAWRPTTGYRNDVYEQKLKEGSSVPPAPSSNGWAWSCLFGLALAF